MATIYLKKILLSQPDISMNSLIDLLDEDAENVIPIIESKLSSMSMNILTGKHKSPKHHFNSLKLELCNVKELEKSLKTNSKYSEIRFEILSLQDHILKSIFEYVQTTPISQHNSNELKNLTCESKSENIVDRYYVECIKNIQALSQHSLAIWSETSSSEKRNIIGSNFYNLANFCYGGICNKKLTQPKNIDKLIIHAILNAMLFDSKEARRLFPCLLELPSLKNGKDLSNEDFFKEYVSTIPDWMFIYWIPQILSYVNTSRPNHLDDIIYRLSLSYPSALKHSFDLWFENAPGLKRQNIQDIKTHLQLPIVDDFVKSLKYLCVPAILLKVHLKALNEYLQEKEDCNQEDYIEQVTKLLESVYTGDQHLQVKFCL